MDSHLSGLFSTVDAFHQAGIDTVGVYTEPIRSEAPLYIRDLNGIKVAIFAYAYGFNGMEGNLETQDYENHLSDLNEEKMESEIKRAEQEADITIIMPKMGVEYQLEPTEEQKTLYHKMIDWGGRCDFRWTSPCC